MSILVIKFGGTSLMDTNKIKKAAQIVAAEVAAGNQVVTVVSAMGHTTDHLIDLAEQVQNTPDKAELDSLLVTGEQTSAALFSMALMGAGLKAQSMNGSTAGLLTDSNFGNATIESINIKALTTILDKKVVPVVAGFQGQDNHGRWTTLGRGGSDTTAVALASALRASRCDIYSDVDGIYSADPNLCTSAFKLDSISYQDMLEMAKHGAQVLNSRSVEIAMRNGVAVRVRSAFSPADQGTLVTRHARQVNWFTGIATSCNKTCIKIHFAPLDAGDRQSQRAFRHQRFNIKGELKSLLHRSGIAFEVGRSLSTSALELSVCLSTCDATRALEVLRNARSESNYESILVEDDLALISVISSDMASSHEVQSIRALTHGLIPISIVINSSNRLSILIPESRIEDAIKQLHANVCTLEMVS